MNYIGKFNNNFLHNIKTFMMQVIDNHLLLSPPLKPQSSSSSNQGGSETRSNASVDSNRSHEGEGNSASKPVKN